MTNKLLAAAAASLALAGAPAQAATPAPVKSIVLVHGGFVDGSGWMDVYKILSKDGYKSGPSEVDRAIGQCLISGGSLPPLAAILDITCLCSQTFMLAESFMSPV